MMNSRKGTSDAEDRWQLERHGGAFWRIRPADSLQKQIAAAPQPREALIPSPAL
jgi:hypothetical protein